MKQSKLPWLIFSLEKGYYAINSAVISSIVEFPHKLTGLHNVPDYICGLMKYREKVIPILDLRKLLDIHYAENNCIMEHDRNQDRIIVIENNQMQIGVIVDAVNAVDVISTLDDQNGILSLLQINYIANVGRGKEIEELILMINDNELFHLLHQHVIIS